MDRLLQTVCDAVLAGLLGPKPDEKELERQKKALAKALKARPV